MFSAGALKAGCEKPGVCTALPLITTLATSLHPGHKIQNTPPIILPYVVPIFTNHRHDTRLCKNCFCLCLLSIINMLNVFLIVLSINFQQFFFKNEMNYANYVKQASV